MKRGPKPKFDIPVLYCERCKEEISPRYITKRGHSRGLKKGIRFCSKRCAMLARGEEKTGWVHKRSGYRMISRGTRGDVIEEHRHVMETNLGRALRSDETVHHRNGVRTDNRPENLELWTSRHCKGQRVEDLVKYAKEILALYDDNNFTEADIEQGRRDVSEVLAKFPPSIGGSLYLG